MNLLDAGQIRDALGAGTRARLDSLDVFDEVDSTNSRLLGQPAPAPGRASAVLAEFQTAGRGRLDRKWLSPPSTGICLSVAYTFGDLREGVASATLAVGIGIARMLEAQGLAGIGIKWPNDLVIRDSKLGGILTEARAKPGDTFSIIVGVGINVALPDIDELRSDIGRVIDLATCLADVPPRNRLASGLIDSVCDALAEFDSNGFARFHEAWPKYDWLHGQRICMDHSHHSSPGVCQGIDADGALIVQRGSERRRYVSGSVRLFGQDGCGPA
jgi:BirA family biotin operon repressor/biotin-[acetyl-CoA-carboxylase] ligase